MDKTLVEEIRKQMEQKNTDELLGMLNHPARLSEEGFEAVRGVLAQRGETLPPGIGSWQPPARSTPFVNRKALKEALASGFGGGVLGGLVAHYSAGDRLTFPIFLIISIVLFAGIKGWLRFVALAIFVAVAALVVTLLG